MQRRGTVTGVAGALAFLLAGCATPGYNPTRVQSELVKAGTTPGQAACVTDGLSRTFDLNQLGSHSDPSAVHPTQKQKDGSVKVLPNEFELTRSILQKCGVKLPLQPPR